MLAPVLIEGAKVKVPLTSFQLRRNQACLKAVGLKQSILFLLLTGSFMNSLALGDTYYTALTLSPPANYPNANRTTGLSMNNRGEVAGYFFDGTTNRPALWINGVGTELQVPAGYTFSGGVMELNSASPPSIMATIGDQLGYSRVVVWNGSTPTMLPPFATGPNCKNAVVSHSRQEGFAINGNGQILGASDTEDPSGGCSGSWFWDGHQNPQFQPSLVSGLYGRTFWVLNDAGHTIQVPGQGTNQYSIVDEIKGAAGFLDLIETLPGSLSIGAGGYQFSGMNNADQLTGVASDNSIWVWIDNGTPAHTRKAIKVAEGSFGGTYGPIISAPNSYGQFLIRKNGLVGIWLWDSIDGIKEIVMRPDPTQYVVTHSGGHSLNDSGMILAAGYLVANGNGSAFVLTPVTTVSVAMNSVPPGLTFSVTGSGCLPNASYTTPTAMQWIVGANCTVSLATIQNGAVGTRNLFSGWSDQNKNNPRTFTGPSADASIQSNFTTQFQLATNVSPASSGIITPSSGWYDSNLSVNLSAAKNPGFVFVQFTGDIAATTTPQVLIMNSPKSVTANFSAGPPDSTITSLSPSSKAAGGAAFTLTVNGTNFAAGTVVLWNGVALPTTVVSGNGMTATVAASLFATRRVVNVTVMSGGVASAGQPFILLAQAPTPDKVGTTYSGYSVLDANGNFAWDGTTADKLISWSTFQTSEKPIYGDWNGDGKTKLGL